MSILALLGGFILMWLLLYGIFHVIEPADAGRWATGLMVVMVVFPVAVYLIGYGFGGFRSTS